MKNGDVLGAIWPIGWGEVWLNLVVCLQHTEIEVCLPHTALRFVRG